MLELSGTSGQGCCTVDTHQEISPPVNMVVVIEQQHVHTICTISIPHTASVLACTLHVSFNADCPNYHQIANLQERPCIYTECKRACGLDMHHHILLHQHCLPVCQAGSAS